MATKKEWKETKINLSHAIIGAAITLILGVLIGIGWNNFKPYLGLGSDLNSPDWTSLDEVYSALTQRYDGEFTSAELIDGARHGLVAALGDTYTEYFNSEEASAFTDELNGEEGCGIGVEIGLRDGYVRVLRTLPDNPAEKAGLLAGDIFYKINGEEIYSESSDIIAQKLRGTAGSEVTVTIYRDGQYLDFTMTREKINNVSAYVVYDEHTAIITVTRFDTTTYGLIKGFVDEFDEKDINKVIVDLRNNGGGYVSAAREILSLWLDGDKIYTQRSLKSADQTTYAYSGRAVLKDMNTIILMNANTASASEIFIGALKDYDKATLVGETTFGKGVVQTLVNLSNGAKLKVTTAHWYTPNDINVQGTGISPDIVVERTWDDINAMRDPQLEKAKSL